MSSIGHAPLGGEAADRLIVALDLPTPAEALEMAERLRPDVRWFKVGLELYTAAGPTIVWDLVGQGAHVFLDLKYHDIPNTVERACAAAARLGCGLINVHAGGGEEMMAAAARGARTGAAEVGLPAPHVLGVTVLTSLAGHELPGYYADRPMPERVLTLARAARDAGLSGVVCSAQEAGHLRPELGPEFILLTPGIRFSGSAGDDQKRVATPEAALLDGADFLVMGRPITTAPDPRAAAQRALKEMGRALGPHAAHS